jgi:hypothetical protein
MRVEFKINNCVVSFNFAGKTQVEVKADFYFWESPVFHLK